MSAKNELIVQLKDVRFSWKTQSNPVLNIQEFDVNRGEHVFIHGPSGSGKTTLLSLISAVISAQSGDIVVDKVPLVELKRGQRDQFRVDRIGLVFQQFNLLPYLSVAENVQLSCRFSATRKVRACAGGLTLDQETDRLLSAMRLKPSEIRNRPTSELSVGQQQRVAVARALIGRPPLIIADEPTSSLDSDARHAFITLLFNEIEAAGSTLLFVSHDNALAKSFNRRVDLRDINSAALPAEFVDVPQ